MRELIERLEEYMGEAKDGKEYRVTIENKDFAVDNMHRYKYEFITDKKYGWREVKNISIKSVLRDMVVKNPKLIGKEIKKIKKIK
jgi:hypothetical protein